MNIYLSGNAEACFVAFFISLWPLLVISKVMSHVRGVGVMVPSSPKHAVILNVGNKPLVSHRPCGCELIDVWFVKCSDARVVSATESLVVIRAALG